MADKTAIEWTDSTWNPLKVASHQWYCEKISPGCDNCYASMFNHRWGADEYPRVGQELRDRFYQRPDVHLDEKTLMLPRSWKQPRMVFVCSMTDVAGEWVPFEWFHAMMTVMAEASRHTYQLLTKRPTRLKEFIERFQEDAPGFGPYPLPNVWAGTTIESDAYAWRANVLRQTPAAIRFVSAEPLLSGLPSLDLTSIDWLISGGESGGQFLRSLVRKCLGCAGCGQEDATVNVCGGTGWSPKPDALEAVRSLRDRCTANGTAFFHKQWGGHTPKIGGRLLDGVEHNEFPRVAQTAGGRG